MSAQAIPVIFDTDPGVDDALALMFALAHPGIDVLGLTTVFGNVTVAQATANALLLTELCNQAVPVAQGAAKPWQKSAHPPPALIHGADGLGELPRRLSSTRGPEPRSAARFIVDTVMARPGEVSLVAVGPMTNLADALKLEPKLARQVRSVVVMGGTIVEPGNVSPVAEANIWNDPHAADHVFSAGWPITMVGLDVTHQVVVTVEMLERVAAAQRHQATDALLHAFRFYAKFYATRHDHLLEKPGSYAHDLLAFVYLLHPEFFEVERGVIRVAQGGLGQGQTMMRRQTFMHYAQKGWEPERPQSQACMKVDRQACLDLLRQTLMRPWLNS